MHSIQCVTKNTKKIYSFLSSSVKIYVTSLLLSTGKKNCSSMAEDLGISYHSIYSYFDVAAAQEKYIKNFLIRVIKSYATKGNPGILIVDCTQLVKLYAKKKGCICYDYNSSMSLVLKGMSCVTTAWTNGKILIPLDFGFWIRKKDLNDDPKYKKKTDIAKELITLWKDKIPFRYVALDGDYGNESFLYFLHKTRLKYSIRMPKNRVVVINGIATQLKNHNAFKLVKNERYKTAKGTYKGIPAFFTCHKRRGKKGSKQIVFVISNLENLTPKQHILAYEHRWPIEKFFRTSKQHLGIHHCQSASPQKQRAHIFAIFLAFSELEMLKIDKKKKSPEQALKIIKDQNRFKKKPELTLLEGLVV